MKGTGRNGSAQERLGKTVVPGTRCTQSLSNGPSTVCLRVNQRDDGPWIVTRCEDVLLHRGKKATFETPELARYVADLHERDGFGNFPALDDGYSWDGRPWIGPGARQTGG